MKKIIIAVVAVVCIVAILVVCAIAFKPADNNEGNETTDTSASTFIETESQTLEPGYIEEETWVGPEIEIE
ncbi:MAG: hypothetical protein IKJ24_04635 [Clostridia bacterium]|nr:hypothetical protein [Clostridia bacterium]